MRLHLEALKKKKAGMAHLKTGGLNVVAPPIAESCDPQLLIMLVEYYSEFGLTWEQANDDTLLMTALEKKAKHHRKDASDVRSIMDKADLTADFSTNIEAQITCDVFKNYLINLCVCHGSTALSCC